MWILQKDVNALGLKEALLQNEEGRVGDFEDSSGHAVD